MTQTNDTRPSKNPIGARRPGGGRRATPRARLRVSSDALISAYIHDIARSPTDGKHHHPHPVVILPPSSMATTPRDGQGGDRGFSRMPSRA